MNRQIRFCMITTFYPPYSFGGDGIFVHRLSNELARRGHQVDVIHCIDSYRLLGGKQPDDGYDDHPNVTAHGLKSPVGFISPLATQQTGHPWFKLARIREILQTGFDVIHYHNVSLVGGPKILEYGAGIKLYTMHEYWLICPSHVLLRMNRDPCDNRTCISCQAMHLRPPQLWRYSGLLKAMVKRVDAFVAPSRFSAEKHRRLGLDRPIVHLPNFVPDMKDEPPMPGAAVEKGPEQPYFLYVGRLESVKGPQTLIPVFQRLEPARLVIAGTGSQESRLRKLAAGSANVMFAGHVSGRQLEVTYRHAVALIVPSICFEVFPLVVLEAFRQQTPVIVRNLGGMPELIEESGGGLVYDTEEELAAAVRQLLADASYGREMGARGYQTYKERWTTEAHLESYFALIHKIAAGRELHR